MGEKVKRYFAYDPESGFETFDLEADGKADAQDAIAYY